jgi:hypothetical protein
MNDAFSIPQNGSSRLLRIVREAPNKPAIPFHWPVVHTSTWT